MGYFQLCNIFAKKISVMRIVGLGNALTDVLARLSSDACFQEIGLLKGGMQLIDEERLLKIMSIFEGLDTTLASGGSAANAVSGVTRMGIEGGFIGKVGRDAYGRFFRDDMERNGVHTTLIESDQASGCAMTMITPDGERTFGTFLGAAATLSAEELRPEMFEGYDVLHIEGYLVQDEALILRAVQLAKELGLQVSFDMASYNVVKENHDIIHNLVENYVDILFANEEEAMAYVGEEPRKAVEILSRYCKIAVVKCGAQGSFVGNEGRVVEVPATPEPRLDSTGAGDLYASGFLYGLSQNCSLGVCGAIGSLLAGRVIKVIGTKMSDEIWAEIKLKVSSMIAEDMQH